jgi:hypothetical protein
MPNTCRSLSTIDELSKAQSDLDAALAAVGPAALETLDKAREALDCLNKSSVTEMRRMANPPAGVKMVGETLCILFGEKPERRADNVLDYWPASKKLMSDARFLLKLKSFFEDGAQISDKILCRVGRFVQSDSFAPDAIKKVSMAAACLCNWVHGVYRFALAVKQCGPEKMGAINRARNEVKKYQALKDLDCLHRGALRELKSLAKPPAGVDCVLAAVCELLTGVMPGVTGNDVSWSTAKKLLLSDDRMLLSFMCKLPALIDAGSVAAQNFIRARKYTSLGHFRPSIMKGKAASAEGVCTWVINILHYHDAVAAITAEQTKDFHTFTDLSDLSGTNLVSGSGGSSVCSDWSHMSTAAWGSLKTLSRSHMHEFKQLVRNKPPRGIIAVVEAVHLVLVGAGVGENTEKAAEQPPQEESVQEEKHQAEKRVIQEALAALDDLMASPYEAFDPDAIDQQTVVTLRTFVEEWSLESIRNVSGANGATELYLWIHTVVEYCDSIFDSLPPTRTSSVLGEGSRHAARARTVRKLAQQQGKRKKAAMMKAAHAMAAITEDEDEEEGNDDEWEKLDGRELVEGSDEDEGGSTAVLLAEIRAIDPSGNDSVAEKAALLDRAIKAAVQLGVVRRQQQWEKLLAGEEDSSATHMLGEMENEGGQSLRREEEEAGVRRLMNREVVEDALRRRGASCKGGVNALPFVPTAEGFDPTAPLLRGDRIVNKHGVRLSEAEMDECSHFGIEHKMLIPTDCNLKVFELKGVRPEELRVDPSTGTFDNSDFYDGVVEQSFIFVGRKGGSGCAGWRGRVVKKYLPTTAAKAASTDPTATNESTTVALVAAWGLGLQHDVIKDDITTPAQEALLLQREERRTRGVFPLSEAAMAKRRPMQSFNMTPCDTTDTIKVYRKEDVSSSIEMHKNSDAAHFKALEEEGAKLTIFPVEGKFPVTPPASPGAKGNGSPISVGGFLFKSEAAKARVDQALQRRGRLAQPVAAW